MKGQAGVTSAKQLRGGRVIGGSRQSACRQSLEGEQEAIAPLVPTLTSGSETMATAVGPAPLMVQPKAPAGRAGHGCEALDVGGTGKAMPGGSAWTLALTLSNDSASLARCLAISSRTGHKNCLARRRQERRTCRACCLLDCRETRDEGATHRLHNRIRIQRLQRMVSG